MHVLHPSGYNSFSSYMQSYASILYLRLPHVFRMILRGEDIEHHNLVNDMMLKDTVSYRPQPGADGLPKNPNVIPSLQIDVFHFLMAAFEIAINVQFVISSYIIGGCCCDNGLCQGCEISHRCSRI